jgi:hypothetical protein
MSSRWVGPAVAAVLIAALPLPAFAADGITVTVNARAGLATVPATAIGVNDAIWDTELGTEVVSGLLGDAGVRMIRYPGGSYGDIYHWETHTAPGGYVAPNTGFDTFMASAKRTGAEPMIIANYGTGSAEEAAAWVRYANVTKRYGARYWAVGNENYGNGHYGSAWEADDHPDKSPTAYANEVVAYSQAMKAVDPSIKVGAVLTTPANWPDALVGDGDRSSWNQTVLSIAGASIDFVDVHWYPGGGTAAEALGRTDQIEDAVYLLRQQIGRYAGHDLGISLTEVNVGVGQNTQPGALFLADAYSRLLAQGVFTVQWWNVHNGIGNVSTVQGQTDYGDFGLLSSGNCTADQNTCEPPLNTPFPAYHALKLMSSFAKPGDQFVRAATSDPAVIAHATRRPSGDLNVLLLNEDPAASHDVTLDYQGYSPATDATVTAYLKGSETLTTGVSGSRSRTLPAYSLTLLTLHPAGATNGLPAAPGKPAVSAVTDRTATISWPAAGKPAKYEIYRQNGAVGEQLGETTGTAFTVRNLEPGTRYTVNVVARNAAGAQSWSSPPLTFTTGSPASSTCAVKLADTNDWGNGFIGSIDVTNNGTKALTDWTLTFTWPTGWQSVSSGWNATWEQTGRAVKVTGSGPLAIGASTNVGFVGAYSGPNVLPGAFRLNGTVCSG